MVYTWLKNLFKKKKKDDKPTPEMRAKLRENLRKYIVKQDRKGQTTGTPGAFGSCKNIPPGYDGQFVKVSDARKEKLRDIGHQVIQNGYAVNGVGRRLTKHEIKKLIGV